ncbi:glycine oxidase ThiO [Azospirillum halopraeferens]|uniref:glycine oxidase ThiO n=1 Tax=Azospirillum halopraeferens TaxID=34010 RepID=UPI000402471D|nr:glycine oxidase ThiO [Azospirillum halopraeferens]
MIGHPDGRGVAASERPAIAVIGGGIIGLAIGWRLAAAGCRVDVFDAGRAGQGATRAAAGMLAADAEAEPGEQALLPLNRLSRSLWPAFAAELEAASGLTVDLRWDGTVQIALSADDTARLRHHHAFARSLGLEQHWLTGAEALRREPHLRPGLGGALFSPGDGQVDNRKVAAALVVALRRAGGRLHEDRAVEEVVVERGRATGVRVAGTLHRADRVVLAAGAWSRRIPGIPPEALPPVRPVKGQMLALRMDPAAPLLRGVVWTPTAYLVPRADGRLIVGATVEERGFDDRLTAGGVYALLDGVWRALPGVEDLPIDEMWTGLRPGSRDDAPVLGPCPVDGLVLATGHHRNGILLAPVTADAVAGFVLTGDLDAAARPFTLDRFRECAA